jgi:hypothetical protein
MTEYKVCFFPFDFLQMVYIVKFQDCMLVIGGYSNICFSLQVNKPSVVFIDEIDALATRYDCMIMNIVYCLSVQACSRVYWKK